MAKQQRSYIAFDYDRQIWTEGETARQLLIKQQNDTLAVLASPAGAMYAQWYPNAMAQAKAILKELES